MQVAAGLLAYNLCFVVAGYGVLAALRRSTSIGDAPIAFLAGAAAVLISASVLATAGYVAGIPVFLLLTMVFASGLAFAWQGRRRPTLDLAAVRAWRPTLSTVVIAALGLAVAAYGFLLLRMSWKDPLSEWDAWAMWTLKAKALIVYGNLHTADSLAAHPDYPLLVPMLQSFAFRFMGQMNTQAVHIEYALIPLAFVGTVWRTLNARIGAAAAAAWALYALLLPGLEVNVPDALGDVPVAVFASLTAFAFAMWLREGRAREWLPLYVIFGAAAVWTKNEGISAVLTIALVGCLLSIRRPLRRHLLPPVFASLCIYLIFLPWSEWKQANGIGNDRNLAQGMHPLLLIHQHGRATRAFLNMWHQLDNVDVWLALPYLTLVLVLVALVRGRDRRVALFALLVPAGLLLSYVIVYTISTDPLGLGWYLATSSSRVVTSVGLISVVVLPVQLLALLDARGADRSRDVPVNSST